MLVGLEYWDEYGEGPRRNKHTFKEIYEKYSKPSAIVDQECREDITRAMMNLDVMFFYLMASVSPWPSCHTLVNE